MPLIKLHVNAGRSFEEKKLLLDAVHEVVIEAFNVPQRDRYQILAEHEASNLIALDTGLNIPRTGNFVLLEIVTRPRSQTEKVNFYKLLASALQVRCGIAPSDIMVSITENTNDDWSFGLGRAHFLTGELGGVSIGKPDA